MASDGGIFTFGDARFYGLDGGIRLNQPIVGMAADPSTVMVTGWLPPTGVSSPSATPGSTGSTGPIQLNKPIVGMAATPDGKGYWLVASDGGIFNFGDAGFYGSTGSMHLNEPVVGMAAAPDGRATGWWPPTGGSSISATPGSIGSTGSIDLNKPVVGMAARPTELGYCLVASDGGIFNYGDVRLYGARGDNL